MGMSSYAYTDTNREEEEKKACDGGNLLGCTNLGGMYDNGPLVQVINPLTVYEHNVTP
jgi:TPR repeat protein